LKISKPTLIDECIRLGISLSKTETLQSLSIKLNDFHECEEYVFSKGCVYKSHVKIKPKIIINVFKSMEKVSVMCCKCRNTFDKSLMIKKKSIAPIYYCESCFSKLRKND